MNAVEILNLSKTYGSITAVDDFSMPVERGRIVALAGPDGAGKTSIFRAACGLLRFETGSITIAGYDVSREFARIKPLLGYMPQTFSLYADLSVEENLAFYAGMFEVRGSAYREKREQLYEFSGLGPFRGRRAGALSGGMKQKLALSCALVHEPEVLVLDEPTTGVDVLSRRQFWNILRELRQRGSTILVSTPYMDEVGLADRAVFLFGGKKLAEGTPPELVGLFAGSVYRVEVSPTAEHMRLLNGIDVLGARRFGSAIHLYTPAGSTIDDFRGPLAAVGIAAEEAKEVDPDLEDAFIQLMEK
jgi:ABC-2 type transport system ATP-binding protein